MDEETLRDVERHERDLRLKASGRKVKKPGGRSKMVFIACRRGCRSDEKGATASMIASASVCVQL